MEHPIGDEPDNPYDEHTPCWLLWERAQKHSKIAAEAYKTGDAAKAQADMFRLALEKMLE